MSTRRPTRRHQSPPRRPDGARTGSPAQSAPAGPAAPLRVGEERSWRWLGPPPRATFAAGWALLPLRAFLGVTFCFAGLQKLANPAFFTASNPASIQSQLAAAARSSPVHGLVSPLEHVAVPLGILIALGELAVGLGTLLGLWTRVAAAGGALIAFLLFLTVSFHSHPYYTGSDIVFVFAWAPLIVAGSGGVLAADAVLANRARRQMGAEPVAVVPIPFSAVRRVCGSFDDGRCRARRGEPCAPSPCPYLVQRPAASRRLAEEEIDRRTFAARGAAAGALAAVGLVGAGAAAALGRLVGGTSGGSATPSIRGGSGSGARPAPPSSGGANRPRGTKIGPASDVPVGGAASFQDPKTGDPSLVVQPQQGTFLAFDAVCPHAGCTVQYEGTGKVFICPCHGSEFSGSTGAVQIGPATTGLGRIGISEGSDGQLYVT